MRIVNGLEQLEPEPRVIALGTFDGVHLGHRAADPRGARARARARRRRARSRPSSPMPSEILRPGQAPRRLSGIERRAELIAQEGVDELLDHRVHARALAALARGVRRAGADRRRPARCTSSSARTTASATPRRATSRRSTALGERLGFGVTAVSLVTADGDRVSSSWIRELVRQGEVMHATRLLGRAPWLDGTRRARLRARPCARRADREPRAGRPAASCRRRGIYAGLRRPRAGRGALPGGDLGRRQPDLRRRRGHGRRGVPDRLRRRRLRPADARSSSRASCATSWRSRASTSWSSRCGATSRPRGCSPRNPSRASSLHERRQKRPAERVFSFTGCPLRRQTTLALALAPF